VPDDALSGLTARENIKRKTEAMALKSFAETIRTWHRRRIEIRELMQLTDHELADLGLHRSEIGELVRKASGH
jgi:uncharacterized protein YjiS (DUF1127 family)